MNPTQVQVKSEISQKPFLDYIHNFRAVAIMFIVVAHCHDELEWDWNSSVGNATYALTTRATVFFVFISGYLFQYLSYKFETIRFLTGKLRNVVLPYLCMSVPIMTLRIILNDHNYYVFERHPDFTTWSVVEQIVFYLTTGAHLIPYWFIPMICIYFLLAPLLVDLDRNGKIYYGLPFFIFLSVMVERNHLDDTFNMFVHYFSVYLSGMFFSRYNKRIFAFSENRKGWLIGVAFAVLLLSQVLYSLEVYREQVLFIQKLMLCWALLFGLWKVGMNFPARSGKLAEMSFGIYFLHYYFIYLFIFVLRAFDKIGYLTGNIWSLALSSSVIFSLCVLTLHVSKKILGPRSRYILGY